MLYLSLQPFSHAFHPTPVNTANLFWPVDDRMNRVPLYIYNYVARS